MSAIRFVASKAAKGRLATGTIRVLCHIKPGASASREGIAAVTDDVIDICVAAQAREGEANAAVRSVFSKALKIPKSDIDITKGLKSRDKTVSFKSGPPDIKPDEEIERIRSLLLSSLAQ